LGKLIFGSLLFCAGILLCFTGIGLLIGIPMVFIGFGMIGTGMVQLGWLAAKGGVAAGRAVSKMREGK